MVGNFSVGGVVSSNQAYTLKLELSDDLFLAFVYEHNSTMTKFIRGGSIEEQGGICKTTQHNETIFTTSPLTRFNESLRFLITLPDLVVIVKSSVASGSSGTVLIMGGLVCGIIGWSSGTEMICLLFLI